MLHGLPLVPHDMILLAIQWTDIRNFLLGMLTGFVLLSLAIAMLMIQGEKQRKKRIIRSKQTALTNTAVADMIEAKQKELTDVVRVSDNSYFRVAADLSLDLMQEIAKYYFPESKYPLYELSAQEIIDLSSYITKRVEKILNGKLIHRFKNYRISLIVDILQKKKALDNSKLMKLNREFKLSKILSVGSTILNYANPIYWFRKLALKPSTTLVIKELCKLIIRIVGEEVDKLYSKKMFESPENPEEIEKKLDESIQEAEMAPIEEPKPKTK